MKTLLKHFVNFVFLLIALPFYIWYAVFSVFMGKDGVLHGVSQAVSLFPGFFGNYLRRAFYRLSLEACDNESLICFGTIISHQKSEIGKGVYIGTHCNLGTVKIENHATIGSGVHILSGKKQHFFEDPDKPIQEQGGIFEKIIIGENSWIGNGAIIMANVGKKCIIGAGSVVTKDIPDMSIAAGNPAKVIKER